MDAEFGEPAHRSSSASDPQMTSTHDATTATVLAHAERHWQAEVENAARLSSRENGILSVIAMLLGLGLFRGPEAQQLEPAALSWTRRGLLVLGVLQVLAALGLVLWIRRPASGLTTRQLRSASFASALLTWPGTGRHMKEVVLDALEADLIAIRVTNAATEDLLARNTRRKQLLDKSQRFLFAAAVSASLAVTCYFWLHPAHRD